MNIYIHIPYCISKCPYCAFYSCTNKENTYIKYFDRLNREVEQKAIEYGKEQIQSIYIGGGTPNLVPSKYIVNTIKHINSHFNISPECEISIELNPNEITEEKIQDYLNVGINRMSIGLQTSIDTDLKILGRRNTYGEFIEKLNILKRNNVNNIGIDLIFGYPTHTLDKWKETLASVTSLDIQHISAYSLEIEEGSVYGKLYSQNRLNLPDESIDRDMYHYAVEYLNSRGFKQYEISNFSKHNYECKHNLNFWNYNNYIGLGAGAYSRVGNMKFSNVEDIDEYIEVGSINTEYIDIKQMDIERKILALRLNKGIPYDKEIYTPIYFNRVDNRICLNEKGKDMYNQVILELI